MWFFIQIDQHFAINHTQWLPELQDRHIHLTGRQRGHTDQGADYVLDGRGLVGGGQNLLRMLFHIVANGLAGATGGIGPPFVVNARGLRLEQVRSAVLVEAANQTGQSERTPSIALRVVLLQLRYVAAKWEMERGKG